MDNSKNIIPMKKRISTHKALRLHLTDQLRLFEDDKISKDKLHEITYTVKAMADLLDKELSVDRLEELEKEFEKLQDRVN
jgi:hypothetical protein